jgi:hypothetical protein
MKKTVILNPLLYRDVTIACGEAVEVHCFTKWKEGIDHFGKNAGVKTEKLPTEEELTEIQKEIDAQQPPFRMMGTDAATMTAIHSYYTNQSPHVFSQTGLHPGMLGGGQAVYSIPQPAGVPPQPPVQHR